jgi:hypothetical protein
MEEALHNATNVDEFKMRASGILSAEQAISTMRPASNSGQTAANNPDPEDIFVKH